MGFGREIKDFLAAMQAGEKMFSSMGDREYKRLRAQLLKQQVDDAADPETRALKKEKTRAEIQRLKRGPQRAPMHPAQEEALRARTDYYKLRQEQLRNPPKVPSAVDDIPSGGLGVPPSRRSALDDPELMEFDTAELGDEYEPEGAIEDEALYAAKGGVVPKVKAKVKKYADGGVVEDEPEVAIDEDDYDDAPEVDAEIAEVEDDDELEGGTQPRGYSPQAAHDAVRDGINYAREATAAPQQKEAVPTDVSAQRRMTGTRAYSQGAGAASVAEMDAVRKAIDPKGEMSESERNLAALAHVYEWNLKQNNPQGAQRAAASMVQYYRQVSDRYKAIAAVAAQNGDVDGAMAAALKAHANIPDGKDMKLIKNRDGSVTYSFTDVQSGKTIEKGIASPEDILKYVTRGGVQSFDDFVVSAAGERTGGGKKAASGTARTGGGKPDPLGDQKASQEQISEAWDSVLAEYTPKGGEPPEVDPKVASALKIDAYHIQMAPENRRRNVSAREAVDAARALSMPNPEAPNDRNFKVSTAEGGRVVTFTENGRSAFIPEEQFSRLIAARGAEQRKLVSGKKMTSSNPGDESSMPQEVKKPGFFEGAGAAIERGSAAVPAGPQGVPSTRPVDRAPRPTGPIFKPWQAVPLDEAPPGSIPGRGLGER
jgi:hypothetical protein